VKEGEGGRSVQYLPRFTVGLQHQQRCNSKLPARIPARIHPWCSLPPPRRRRRRRHCRCCRRRHRRQQRRWVDNSNSHAAFIRDAGGSAPAVAIRSYVSFVLLSGAPTRFGILSPSALLPPPYPPSSDPGLSPHQRALPELTQSTHTHTHTGKESLKVQGSLIENYRRISDSLISRIGYTLTRSL